jgi:hypothetical protein
MTIKNQSEQDFPRGAMRNGLIDGTKCQSEERKVTCFCCYVLQIRLMAVRNCKMAWGTVTLNGRSG